MRKKINKIMLFVVSIFIVNIFAQIDQNVTVGEISIATSSYNGTSYIAFCSGSDWGYNDSYYYIVNGNEDIQAKLLLSQITNAKNNSSSMVVIFTSGPLGTSTVKKITAINIK